MPQKHKLSRADRAIILARAAAGVSTGVELPATIGVQ
jgi:hypothetical protein